MPFDGAETLQGNLDGGRGSGQGVLQRGLREHAVGETALGAFKTGPFPRQQRIEVGLDQGRVEPSSGEGGFEGFKETSFIAKTPTGAGKVAVAWAVMRFKASARA